MGQPVLTARSQPTTTWRTLVIAVVGLLLPFLWPGVLKHLFDTRPFTMTHADAGWPLPLTLLHLFADGLIGVAYTFIAGILAYIVYQHRRLLPFDWVVLAFGLFIVACGTTHFMHVLVMYVPAYWLDGYLRGVTAVVSVATAVALPPLVPRIAQLLTAEQAVAAKQADRHPARRSSLRPQRTGAGGHVRIHAAQTVHLNGRVTLPWPVSTSNSVATLLRGSPRSTTRHIGSAGDLTGRQKAGSSTQPQHVLLNSPESGGRCCLHWTGEADAP
ncbi:hypothetical protein E7T06_13935 [Deinococcus sp. Arct2-2]|uniref:hypothetical protein n=1 Tax=Deinococcus sp. Arct2-2 TaxID=2568653 RepID=UPI0010A37AB1|nr:hypothetical protein [Deinococcus sp. Arct2-2]THF68965.1 hypothetical protein E7T06_13935 [Deinococcus sp. Arct2-2]